MKADTPDRSFWDWTTARDAYDHENWMGGPLRRPTVADRVLYGPERAERMVRHLSDAEVRRLLREIHEANDRGDPPRASFGLWVAMQVAFWAFVGVAFAHTVLRAALTIWGP